MSRSQSGDIANQAQANSTADQTNAQSAETAEAADVNNYQAQLSKYAAENPYTAGGEYQTSQNQTLAGNADAGSAALNNQLQTQAKRTGQNATAANATAAEVARANQRELGTQEASANQQRIGDQSTYNASALQDQATAAALQQGLYSTSIGAGDNSLNTATQASKDDESTLDSITGDAMQLGSAAIGAFCPANGSLYLLPDGTEVPVETLRVGELLEGIDTEPQTIEDIQSAVMPILRVETDDGFVGRNSHTHAYALPVGGFVEAIHALGKTILTAKGRSKVISVTTDGEDTVFNVITNGSHTYRADGIWALGMGEAERVVSMDTWKRVGDHMAIAGVQ
jgi:hypothetical protein